MTRKVWTAEGDEARKALALHGAILRLLDQWRAEHPFGEPGVWNGQGLPPAFLYNKLRDQAVSELSNRPA